MEKRLRAARDGPVRHELNRQQRRVQRPQGRL